MEQEKLVAYTTVLLSMVAGFCDAATFVAANEVFSAHVTGNFILFAYDLVRQANGNTWVKLLTFPAFILAVILGGAIARRSTNGFILLLIEGCLLCLVGIMATYDHSFTAGTSHEGIFSCVLVLGIVIAMGVQNCYGKLFAKTTYGPTTMMTGNVTQAALDLGTALAQGFNDTTVTSKLAKDTMGIGGFLAGCILGAFSSQYLGLSVIVFPGISILIFYLIVTNYKPA